jgi:hypothetical protein
MPTREEAIMTRGYTLLALGLVVLGGAARAGEIGAAQLPPESTPAAGPAASPAVNGSTGPAATAAAGLAALAPPPTAAPCCGCAPCATPCCACTGRHHSACWARLCDWLTYCPPVVSCHHGCGTCGGGCRQCTPCCTPLYMYFLDRCSCTLGYKPMPPHLPGAPPAQDEGPNGPPSETATPGYGTPATAGR